MHSAASVSYPVVRSRRVGWLVAVLWCGGMLPIGAWLLQVVQPPLLQAGVAAWSVAIGLVSLTRWWRTVPDFLAWDGQAWRTGKVVQARVTTSLDFQSLMLLRVAPCVGHTQWFFVERATAPAKWHGLRCALLAAAYPAHALQHPVSTG